ncbi:MAG TPA: ATP-dependent DNA helicase RecG [Firmicutes bacterium]|nr:ATP-dependent DNA helicase RecG [Bacillota bacterium]HBX25197.1 ATP-dependent DNA helicase RecG [Bacillota bacterium]
MKLVTSPKLNSLLMDMGIHSYYGVICHMPRKYESFFPSSKIALLNLKDKDRVCLEGNLIGNIKTVRFSSSSNSRFYFHNDIDEEDYEILAWNRPYLSKELFNDDKLTLNCIYDQSRHVMNLLSFKKTSSLSSRLLPLYSLPSSYPEYSFRSLVKKALNELSGSIYDRIPTLFRNKYKLISREEAFNKVHFPSSLEDIRQGMRTLKYEEALTFSLHNVLIREENALLRRERNNAISRKKLDEFILSLPFSLTEDQTKVVNEILLDMSSPKLMYRLLQGDVGSGKTLVALIATYANYLRGEQTALMAPTSSLAKQHYDYFSSLLSKLGIKVTLLVGSMGKKEKEDALEEIKNGNSNVVIGTHALFSKDVFYANLGLVLIDEQHKFGVNQRTTLANKGNNADLLLMSATPIPRTLSLTLYGDLDVSTLNHFPFKKRDVKTVIVEEKSKKILSGLKYCLENKKKAYVISPQIEKGEGNSSCLDVYKKLEKRFPGLVSLCHGKMNEEEKEQALNEFKSGKKPILVATSIVEVGIDVKDANLMIVFSPTSFSLSSLHQLRGRIGRDGERSYCLLVSDKGLEADKLKVLVESNDGFKIAEEDLRLRGPGTLAGVKQSGLPNFNFVDLSSDLMMFAKAREDASYIFAHKEEKQFNFILFNAKKEVEGASLA